MDTPGGALAALLESDLVPLVAIAVLALEGVVLLRPSIGARRIPADLVASFLASGAALLAALYFHRRPGGALGFGVAMTAALVLHLWHLARLARRSEH
jgi:hypothetical protein